MATLLSESEPVARKDHNCDACESLNYHNNGLTFSELRDVVKAKRNGWKIKKGQKYIRQNILSSEGIYTFKAIPEIDYICRKYDFYGDY